MSYCGHIKIFFFEIFIEKRKRMLKDYIDCWCGCKGKRNTLEKRFPSSFFGVTLIAMRREREKEEEEEE